MKKILITGATGTVGSEVARLLSAQKDNVRAAVRNPDKAREMDLGNAKIVHWDWGKSASIARALENTEQLLLISPSGIPNTDKLLIPAINAAKTAGVKHIVFISFKGVETNDEIPYRKVELHMIASGIDYTIVRPNFFMQNFTTWMAESVKGGAFYLPAGSGKTSFVDTNDLVAVLVKTLTDKLHLNKEYSLTGTESLDYGEVAQKLSTVTGKTVAYNDVPESDFESSLMGYGYSEDTAKFMTMLYSPVKAGYCAETTGDVQKILGKAPGSFDAFAEANKAVWE